MACLLTKGRADQCNDSLAGVYKIYFINYNTMTPTLDANNYITEINSGLTVYEYLLYIDSVSKAAEDMVQLNGTTLVTQTITIDLKKLDQDTNNEIKLLAYGRPHMILQDNEGNSKLFGRQFGLTLTSSIGDTGASKGDNVGYSITLIGKEREYANFLSGATFSNAFAGMGNQPTIVTG